MGTNHRGSILVIEDDSSIREGLIDLLEDEGYRAVGCSSGHEALRRLRENMTHPCLVLLDWHMPMMDGAEFCRQRDQDPALSSIPVVVLSADWRVHAQVSDLGIAACIDKPFLFNQVLDLVAEHCG